MGTSNSGPLSLSFPAGWHRKLVLAARGTAKPRLATGGAADHQRIKGQRKNAASGLFFARWNNKTMIAAMSGRLAQEADPGCNEEVNEKQRPICISFGGWHDQLMLDAMGSLVVSPALAAAATRSAESSMVRGFGGKWYDRTPCPSLSIRPRRSLAFAANHGAIHQWMKRVSTQ